MNKKELELRRSIIAASRGMNASGINQGTSGNISARFGEDMLITPSGVRYEEMAPRDIARMTLTGEYGSWEGRLDPYSEWRFHLDIMKERPEVGAVVHTHSTYATTLAICGKEIPAIHYMMAAADVRRLEKLKLPPSSYNRLLSSGEAAWQGLRDRTEPPFDQLGRRCVLITRGDDRAIVDGIDIECVPDPSLADFIFLAGLDDEYCEPDLWRSVLNDAARRRLPLLCANPDLTMIGAGGLLPGPGTLARLYESLGGTVHYVGKPYRPIFAAALRILGGPPPARVLVVGDSIDHDIRGGNDMGMLRSLRPACIAKRFQQLAIERISPLPSGSSRPARRLCRTGSFPILPGRIGAPRSHDRLSVDEPKSL